MKNDPITVFEKLKDAATLGKMVTLIEIADPRLNIDHNQRVTLTLDKKQCGTIIPLILFMGLKLRYLVENNLTSDPGNIDKVIHGLLRQTLMEIRREGETEDQTVYYGKTLQEKVFKYLVFNTPLFLENKTDILTGGKENKVHTVSNGSVQGENPSFTVPCYLCRYFLKKDGLHPDTPFVNINPSLKMQAKETYSVLKMFPKSEWENVASFSRRVHNRITLNALRRVFSEDELSTPLKHPYY